MFHKEGHKILLGSLIGFILIVLISNSFVTHAYVRYGIFITCFVLFILIAQFFRNPKRQPAHDEHFIVSPVDGKIVAIEEVHEPEFFKEKRLLISVFMSPINVHVTRYPVSGEVVYSKYHPGKYLVAWHPKSSESNERTTVVIKSQNFGDVLFRQIAGAMARRIVNYAEIGHYAKQGTDSGFIKFGSRVDVYLPLQTQVKVKMGDKVKGAESLIAEI
ncbi:MAG: phosphatidylserine decarboxylase family protein [Psychroflexus sp.]|nr:phosphatidylserine decarboxylase family protein [Psychroflexus sp.]MDN6309476.1 phosphatidylserine decarboxylase family protein [Psychroflexus sp.]